MAAHCVGTCIAPAGQSELLAWAQKRKAGGRFMWKSRDYFDVYERHLARFRQQQEPVVMLEMG
eukprot:5801555-Prymnesium_polylepis.1